MTVFIIGGLELGKDDDINPGPKHAEWRKTNVVNVKEITGKGKKTVTVRTSDQTLEECTLTIRSITNERYRQLLNLCDHGGPYEVLSNHGAMWMYIIDRSINHSDQDKEPPLTEILESGEEVELNVATWTIQLLEAHN